MNPVLSFLSSLRLARILILTMMSLMLLSTFIPQEPPAAGGFVSLLGFDRMFRSPLFLAAAALFALNLGTCTALRLAGQIRGQSPFSPGPDIIHAGLLLCMAGAALSMFAGLRIPVVIAEGEALVLADDARFLAEGIDDGGLSGRIVLEGASGVAASVRVNHPLRFRGYSLFLRSLATRFRLVLDFPGSPRRPVTLAEGDEWQGFRFATVRVGEDGAWRALFVDPSGEPRALPGGDMFGDARCAAWEADPTAVLDLSRDPGKPVVFTGFALVAAGLGIWLVRGRKRRRV